MCCFPSRTFGRLGLATAILLAPSLLRAQDAGADRRTSRANRPLGDGVASPATLVVQPTRGDVLRLEMEQVIEMAGARRDAYALPEPAGGAAGGRTSSPEPALGPRRNATATRVTMLHFFAHSVVDTVDAGGSVLSSTSDSLLVRSGEAGQLPAGQRVPLPAPAAPVRIRVAANGAMTMLDGSAGTAAVGATLSGMPALLPDDPVMVGDEWTRDVEMPPLPLTVYKADGVLRAVFRLDSMSRGGRTAWVSIRGELHRDGAARELPPGSRVVTAGTMTGTLLLDRVRGWIVDARTTINVHSEVVSSDARSPPVHVNIRIVQRLHVR